MFRKTVCFVVIVCFLFPMASCATIISGRNQSLPIVSTPSGAIVTIGSQKQPTPATFILDRRMETYVVKIEKEGYEPIEITLKKGVNGWVWGNLLFGLIGGFIGLVIDMSNGSASKFTPNEIEVNLAKKQIGLNNLEGKDILFVRLVQQ